MHVSITYPSNPLSSFFLWSQVSICLLFQILDLALAGVSTVLARKYASVAWNFRHIYIYGFPGVNPFFRIYCSYHFSWNSSPPECKCEGCLDIEKIYIKCKDF